MGFTQFSFFLPGHHDMWCLGVSSVVVQNAFCIIQLIGCRRKVLFRSSKSAFSRHDNVRTSSTLFIWLNENVLFSFLEKCVFSPWQYPNKLDIVHLAYRKRSFLVSRKVRFLAMTMFEQAWHCSFGLTKTFVCGSSCEWLGLSMVPTSQIVLNKQLTQNPGYNKLFGLGN